MDIDSTDDLVELHKEITDSCREILKRKNHDYTSDSDPFANFEACEGVGACQTEQGFIVRIVDKLMRLSTFIKKDELKVKNEPMEDAIKDIINYCILFYGYVKDKEESEEPKRPKKGYLDVIRGFMG